MSSNRLPLPALLCGGAAALLLAVSSLQPAAQSRPSSNPWDQVILQDANARIREGREIFRFDTFGSEAFFGGVLQLHKAIAGSALGGVGPGVSPATALAVGLKVDVEALPAALVARLKRGEVDLTDPKTTLALLKLDAVVGLKGFVDANGRLETVGIRCALCHSTVDDSLTFGIGKRLDGWANRDLDVGTILSLSPDVGPSTKLLQIADPSLTDGTVRSVLKSWGPGKFDAQLLLDGKAMNPVTGQTAATLLPNAYGLAGHNLHTWGGGWGGVTYWNAFVGNIEMNGKGTFFDTRLDNASQYPIAAAVGMGHLKSDPSADRITKNLAALQFYQLAIPAPRPRPGVDFLVDAAVRGKELFVGKAGCNECHVTPLWTEPGWNAHKPADIKIESFQADRSPDRSYRTMGLAGLFVRENGIHMKAENRGRYYHDGRFKTLLDVVESYNTRFALELSGPEKRDVVEYLKSLYANGSAIDEP